MNAQQTEHVPPCYEDYQWNLERNWCANYFGKRKDDDWYSDISDQVAGENSSILPMNFINNVSQGRYIATPTQNSSNPNIELFDTPYLYDKNHRILISYRKQNVYDTVSWIDNIIDTELEQPSWIINKKYNELFSGLSKFFNLEKNWDSYGAPVIDKNCITESIAILSTLLEINNEFDFTFQLPFIAPRSDGGIQLEWEKGSRYLEISLSPNDENIKFFAMDETENGHDLSLDGKISSYDGIKRLIFWFTDHDIKDLVHLNI
jgi:hypothetical protein